MAPRSVSTVPLAAGDIVSAAAYSWGRPFARQMGDNSGRNDEVRVEGKVLHAEGNKWVVDFGDDKDIAWKRGELRFVSRPGAQQPVRASRPSAPIQREDSSDEEQQDQEEGDGAAGHEDSDDTSEDEEVERHGRVGRPDHAMYQGGDGGVAPGEARCTELGSQ